MSRAYRIKVSESLRKVLKTEDGVCTQLELLNLLPPGDMAALLAQELTQRGFTNEGSVLQRAQDGIVITINPQDGAVTVQAGDCAEVELEAEKEGYTYQLDGKAQLQARKDLKEQVRAELEQRVKEQEKEMQSKLSDKLEGQLLDLKRELDQVVNKVTIEALKKKAAQLGKIKEMSEDPQAGSMTIVLEV